MSVPRHVGAESMGALEPLLPILVGLFSEAKKSPWRGRHTDENNDNLLPMAQLSVEQITSRGRENGDV